MNAAVLAEALAARLGGAWTLRALHASGFCDTWQAADRSGTRLFIKTSAAAQAAMLSAEAEGLDALAATQTIRTPAVACLVELPAGGALLALEWLDLAPPDAGFGARFGERLAALHAQPRACFGWASDNFLGGTMQVNGCTPGGAPADWLAFWREQRLGAMRQRVGARAAPAALLKAIDDVADALPALFADGYIPKPSLIHGDLWSGNWGMDAHGIPVIYDPAVSQSDAEAELAMMELFGAPPSGFWNAYSERHGAHAGYARRRPLYQLYHLLNHALLFGGGYTRQALESAARVLAAAR